MSGVAPTAMAAFRAVHPDPMATMLLGANLAVLVRFAIQHLAPSEEADYLQRRLNELLTEAVESGTTRKDGTG